MMPDVSIVVPLYNEQDSVEALVLRVADAFSVCDYSYELILVNDGSSDQTVAITKELIAKNNTHIRLIDLQRNFGQTAAMQAGIDAAIGEFLVTMDGDLQNDPADIPRMLTELVERDLDLLQGWRADRKDALVSRKIPSRIANALIQKVTGVKLHDYGCSLKVYRSHVLKQIRLYGEMHRFIPVWMATVTAPHRIGETKVTHHARQFGESKYGISRTFRVVVDLLAAFFFLRFRARPGHFFGMIGLFFGFAASMLFSYLGIVKFVLQEDIGTRPLLLMAAVLLVAALQFLTIGVVAEMLSRVLFQTTNQNSYTVREECSNFKETKKS